MDTYHEEEWETPPQPGTPLEEVSLAGAPLFGDRSHSAQDRVGPCRGGFVEVYGVDLGTTRIDRQRANVVYVCEPDEMSRDHPTLRTAGTWVCWN